MAKKTKRKRDTASDPACQLVIRERLKALDDAVDASVHSIADHVGLTNSVSTVTNGLFMSAAAVVWHATSLSEEEFVETARRCYQRIAEGHAHCERGEDGEGSLISHHGRANLN
jgi:hypothetical protein